MLHQTAHLALNVGNVVERDSLLSPLIGWQLPDGCSIGKAQKIFDDIVFPALNALTSLAGDGGKTEMTKDEIIGKVQIISMAVEGAAESLPPDIVEVYLCNGLRS